MKRKKIYYNDIIVWVGGRESDFCWVGSRGNCWGREVGGVWGRSRKIVGGEWWAVALGGTAVGFWLWGQVQVGVERCL